MVYNIDYLVASLIFLLIILLHFALQRRTSNENDWIFLFFITVGILDIGFDIVCTVLISLGDPVLNWLTWGCLTMLYLLQVLVPYAMLVYIRSLQSTFQWKQDRMIRVMLIPLLVMMGLILGNYHSGIFFQISDEGVYARGPFYLGMYGFAFVYVMIMAVDSVRHGRDLGWRKFSVIGEFIVIAVICVLIQARNHQLLITGFAIALGITVLFLTINNPYSFKDSLTGLLDAQYFREWIRKKNGRSKPFHVVSVDLSSLRQINALFGNSVGDALLIKTAEALSEIGGECPVFRTAGNRFVLAMDTLWEYERVRDGIRKFSEHIFKIEENEIRLPFIICGICEANALKEGNQLLAYIEYLAALRPESEGTIVIQSDEETLKGFQYSKTIEQYLRTVPADSAAGGSV